MSAEPPDTGDGDTNPSDDEQGQQPDSGQDGGGQQDGDQQSGEGRSTGTVGTSQSYAIEASVFPDPAEYPEYNYESGMQIGEVTVPGIYDVTQSGAGRKSQYLKETQVGSTDTQQTPTYGGIDQSEQQAQNGDGSTGGGGGQSDDSSGGGTKTPPLTLDIKAYVGSETYTALADLRTTPATEQKFTVTIGDIELAEMELVELQRSLSGTSRELYDVSLKVREYRKYEVIDNRVQQYGLGGGGGGGGRQAIGGANSTPIRKWVDNNNDGLDDRTNQPLPTPETVGSASVSLSGGDAFENKKVTGPFTLTANGNGWAVRNVGIDYTFGSAGNHSEPVTVRGNGIFENCWFGRGSQDGVNNAGVYVHLDHTGTILFRFCYFEGFYNGGIYGSDFSKLWGNGNSGKIIVENCYFRDNAINNIRIGKGVMRNSVTHEPHSHGNRSIWAPHNNVQITNCDIGGRLVIGWNPGKTPGNGGMTLSNCRWNGEGGVARYNKHGTISGHNAARGRTPNFAVPNNVPTSPDQAMNGRYYSMPPGGGGGQ